jgi:hypothetical protein
MRHVSHAWEAEVMPLYDARVGVDCKGLCGGWQFGQAGIRAGGRR